MDTKMGRPVENAKPKQRFTLYLDEDTKKKFNELYAFRVMRGCKDSKSDVVCNAIEALHASEFKKLKGERS